MCEQPSQPDMILPKTLIKIRSQASFSHPVSLWLLPFSLCMFFRVSRYRSLSLSILSSSVITHSYGLTLLFFSFQGQVTLSLWSSLLSALFIWCIMYKSTWGFFTASFALLSHYLCTFYYHDRGVNQVGLALSHSNVLQTLEAMHSSACLTDLEPFEPCACNVWCGISDWGPGHCRECVTSVNFEHVLLWKQCCGQAGPPIQNMAKLGHDGGLTEI